MPDALFTILTVFGWIAVIVGAVLLVWDGVTHRILSRPGLAAVVVGVVLLDTGCRPTSGHGSQRIPRCRSRHLLAHPVSWGHSRRSTTIRDQHRRQHPPERCAGCGATNVPLIQDHIINLANEGTDTIDNYQWLCHPCHEPKTQRERIAGLQRKQRYRNQRRRLPARPHPGDG